jgi:hypothetical protein
MRRFFLFSSLTLYDDPGRRDITPPYTESVIQFGQFTGKPVFGQEQRPAGQAGRSLKEGAKSHAAQMRYSLHLL